MTLIDLRSDTATRPPADMRQAMAAADVGDEQIFEDPTVNQLVERVCDLLGQEDAAFLPSATMANLIAFCVLGERGRHIVGHYTSHSFGYEDNGYAVVAGMTAHKLHGERGMYTAEALQAGIKQGESKILLVENTTNIGGGAAWPLEDVKAVADLAKQNNMICHLDGSRLLNAQIARGTPAAEYGRLFDSVTLCFSKGLACPVGAVIAGSSEMIKEAWRWKQILGGAMRQSGIIAAAALYALDHYVDRLAEDHANARLLAEGIADLPGLKIDLEHLETNIMIFEVDPEIIAAKDLVEKMKAEGVLFYALGPATCRMVTHIDTPRPLIEAAIKKFRSVCRGA